MPPRCLAAVEWQLVMHCLHTADLLRLGRCSIQLSQCAANPFAWLHTEAHVELTALQLGNKLANTRCLFAAAPLVFTWLPPFGRNSEALTKGQIDRLLKIPFRPQQLRSLDCSAFRAPLPSMWHLLLSDLRVVPFVQSLILPHCGDREATVDVETIRLISDLPMLRSLKIDPGGCDLDIFLPLPHAPALTSLNISDSDRLASSRLELIAACPHLRSLVIHRPCFTGSLFRSFFASASICRLRSLTLNDWCATGMDRDWEDRDPDPILAADVRLAMSSMAELEELTLWECDKVQKLMPHLSCLPAIQRVRLWGKYFSFTPSYEWLSPSKLRQMDLPSSMPDTCHVQSLLTDMPRLRCVLAFTLEQRKRAQDEPVIRAWAQPLLDQFGDRIDLRRS